MTSLHCRVDANKKFGYSAEDTLKTVQNLYEKKLVSYPRVDTTYLSEDLHAKVPGILSKLKNYGSLTESILAAPIKKSKSIFNNKKITDHHAIIPTGEIAQGLQGSELSIYDLICRRFIAVFYPPCIVSNTTVMGKVDQLDFKTTGKQIIEPGWRKVYSENDSKDTKEPVDNVLPLFEKEKKDLTNHSFMRAKQVLQNNIQRRPC